MISCWMVGFLTLMTISCGGNNDCDPWDLWWLMRVPLHPQETDKWCWAASAQMVMDYLEHNTSQCIQANLRFYRSDCCNSPIPGDCIGTGWPEFWRYGFDYKKKNGHLSWNKLKEQISSGENCKATPFCFSWEWSGGGGHMMVVSGYVDNGEYGRDVFVMDPSPPNVGSIYVITYEYFKESRCHHTHWRDYYDIEYTGGP